jgi:hypothetical protein
MNDLVRSSSCLDKIKAGPAMGSRIPQMVFGLFKKKQPSRDTKPIPHYSVWLTQLGKINGLLADLKIRLESKRAVIVVTHFADTFEQLNQLMAPAPIQFKVLDQSPVRKHVLPGDDGGPAMYLLHSEQLLGESMPDNIDVGNGAGKVAEHGAVGGLGVETGGHDAATVIIAEIHGSAERNERVEWLIEALPFEVEVLRHVWMEEPVMQSFVGEKTMEFLEQMGISEHERVEHPMVDGAINRALDLMGKKVRSEQPAKTAEQWMRLNLPEGIGG